MEFFATLSPFPLQQLPTMAAVSDAQGVTLLGVTFVEYPREGCLTFCENPPSGETIDVRSNSTVLVSHHLADRLATSWPAARLVRVDDPRASFIDTLEYLHSNKMIQPSSLLPNSPTISPHARIGAGAIIEAGVQIDADVIVGNGAVVHAGTWLKRGSILGDNCVVGGTGINAYVGQDGRRRNFPHVAGVIIGEGASLGSGCVVVRGILSSTRIGENCIIGNLCNIGHGVEIANDVWISVGTLIGGHTRVGTGATIAMGCTIRDNLRVGDHTNVGMGSTVTKHVRTGTSVFGNPARTHPSITAGPVR